MPEQEAQQSNNQKNGQHAVGYILTGGVVGAGLGLLSNPGTAQKIYRRVQDSETGQLIANELGKNIQQLIAQQTVAMVQQAAPVYLDKAKSRLTGTVSQESTPKETNHEADEAPYQEIKQENKQINKRLDNIEEKLDQLLHASD